MSELAQLRFAVNSSECVATVSGEIDLSNAAVVRTAIDDHIDDAPTLVINLAETTFLDSAAIAILLDIGSRMRTARRDFVLVIPDDSPIRRIAKISGLDAQVSVVSSRGDVA